MNILMIFPKLANATDWWKGFPQLAEVAQKEKGSERNIFNRRRGFMPPLALLTVAAYLPDDFDIRLIDRNLNEETEADWKWADAILLSLMAQQQEDDYRMCLANARRHKKPIAVGGSDVFTIPQVIAADADWVCHGEAEDIMAEFVEDLRADRRNKQYYGNTNINMEAVKTPRYDLLGDNINEYWMMPMQFSRGCPFNCEFCDNIEIFGRVSRVKKPEQICTELTALKKAGFKRGLVFFVDDNFIGNKRKAMLMLDELAVWNKENGYPYRYYTQSSLDLANKPALLDAMHKANFMHVFIGIETPDVDLLKGAQKMQNVPGDQLDKFRIIRQHGVHVVGGFIVGFDGEKHGVFDAQRVYIQQAGIGVPTLSLLRAIEHTQLYKRLKLEGRLLERGQTIQELNFIPKGEITKREYLLGYSQMMKEVYEPNAFFERSVPALLTLRRNMPARSVYSTFRWALPLLGREMYHYGIKGKGMRRSFWKSFFKVLMKNPLALDAFAMDTADIYYIRRSAALLQKGIHRYLSAPTTDVLNEAVPVDPEPKKLRVVS
jgi:radical SAM superfamily enzyme YgiQ (UPF0313 family)